MTTPGYILLFSFLGSLGAVFTAGLILVLPGNLVRRWLPGLVSYAIGTLLGASLLGMIPHALDSLAPGPAMITILAGLVGFFVLESLVLWRHCHEPDCPIHGGSGILILVGDAFHNFVDGMVISSAFLSAVPTGISASLAILAHEIPQEAGDFAILLQAGYSRPRAFALNALSASTTMAGALVGYLGIQAFSLLAPYVLCVSAASFLYIALADLIPGRRGRKDLWALAGELALIAAGIATVNILRCHP